MLVFSQNHILKSGVEVKLSKSAKAKRIIIKIRHGQAELIIPKRGNLKTALKFLNSKEDWIVAKLETAPQKTILNIGTNFPLFGKPHEIIYAGLRGKSEIIDSKLFIRGDILSANKKIKKLLYQTLKDEIELIAVQKAKAHALTYKKISIRDNISRWGSCSTTGNLSFCWRLVFAPREIVEYLVCHELAHLKEMNHSAKFWAVVATIYPDYKSAELWLKKNGNSLYLYD